MKRVIVLLIAVIGTNINTIAQTPETVSGKFFKKYCYKTFNNGIEIIKYNENDEKNNTFNFGNHDKQSNVWTSVGKYKLSKSSTIF